MRKTLLNYCIEKVSLERMESRKKRIIPNKKMIEERLQEADIRSEIEYYKSDTRVKKVS